ncbi:MAG: LLM class F420-dependent oxidoreductase [Chloroflexi bacterium]|nr:LLM class F420-dependent oxidoreductase [Chloroflexota bacterium]MCL5275017.1 LLM class F420-dependent oxidoreductase [Chloroflexota bacterium]
MKVGLQIPSFTWPGGSAELGARLGQIAVTAEEAGFASLWVMDHFFQIGQVGKVDEPMLESYSALNYIAALTHKARLGTLVTGVVYRHPGILVKTVSTLDVLSGGRAYLGIGAAWNERESLGLGVPFPPLKERFERLEEALKIAKQMWSGAVAPFEGRYYHLAEAMNNPQPIRRPHPPILIGGMGEKKTLKLVARYADACNLFARTGIETLRGKLDVLRRYCDEFKRPYDAIERTALTTINLGEGGMTARQAIDEFKELAGIGIQHVIVYMPNTHEIKPIEIIGREIIPAVAGM